MPFDCSLTSFQGLITPTLSPFADRHVVQRLDQLSHRLEVGLRERGESATVPNLDTYLRELCQDSVLARKLSFAGLRGVEERTIPILYQVELRRLENEITPLTYYMTGMKLKLLEEIVDCVVRKKRLRCRSSRLDPITLDDVLYALRDDCGLSSLLY